MPETRIYRAPSRRHVASIERDGDTQWMSPRIRTVCSCGWVGDWRNPAEFSADAGCPDGE